VADIAARGGDVVLVRGDTAAVESVVSAADAARMLVLDIDSMTVHAKGQPDRALAPRPESVLTSFIGEQGALVAVEDSLGDAVVASVPVLADERLVRVGVSGSAAGARRSWGDDVDAVLVAGLADSAGTARAASDLVAGGRDPGSILIASDLPLAPEVSGRLTGSLGIVETLPASVDELSRIRAEDPAVVDPSQGVRAYRAAVAVVLGAVQAADDGGLRIAQALPGIVTGASACTSIAMCVDVLDHEGQSAYLPVAGALGSYAPTGWESTGSPWGDVRVDNRR
jgi:hypothetical protein